MEKDLRRQNEYAHSKLHEAKLAVQSTKMELQRYQRALAKEGGEEAPLNRLLEEGSGAKGRAQQITLLKEHVRTLTRKLQVAGGGGADVPPASPTAGGERQRAALANIEQERRRDLERRPR